MAAMTVCNESLDGEEEARKEEKKEKRKEGRREMGESKINNQQRDE